MRTIGSFLKHHRLQKKLTISDMEEKTRIKPEFLKAIEKEQWQTLPDYPVVLGFVKSIAGFLSVDEQKAVALLRRDYPPQKLSINPKPDLPKKLTWSPKLTFFVGVLIVGIVVVGYLALQYSSFVRPPRLEVLEPVSGQQIVESTIVVKGQTDPDSSVQVNNQPVLLSEDGKFEAEINVSENTKQIVVKAVSRSGKQSEVVLPISVNFN